MFVFIMYTLTYLLLGSLGVGSDLLGTSHNVDESSVELDSLLGAASSQLLLVILLLNLGGLVSHLTGTSKRAVHLSTTSQAEHQVQSGLLLDVVISQSAAIFQLLASEDQSLLVRRNALLVLDLLLDIVNGVGRLDFQSNCLTSEGLNENLQHIQQQRRTLNRAQPEQCFQRKKIKQIMHAATTSTGLGAERSIARKRFIQHRAGRNSINKQHTIIPQQQTKPRGGCTTGYYSNRPNSPTIFVHNSLDRKGPSSHLHLFELCFVSQVSTHKQRTHAHTQLTQTKTRTHTQKPSGPKVKCVATTKHVWQAVDYS
jgi:hypothetical protein